MKNTVKISLFFLILLTGIAITYKMFTALNIDFIKSHFNYTEEKHANWYTAKDLTNVNVLPNVREDGCLTIEFKDYYQHFYYITLVKSNKTIEKSLPIDGLITTCNENNYYSLLLLRKVIECEGLTIIFENENKYPLKTINLNEKEMYLIKLSFFLSNYLKKSQ
jgi:hypothetical protein